MSDYTDDADFLKVDHSFFEIDGTIIAIVRRDTLNDPIAPQLAASLDGGEKGLLVPFFTDEDLALRFLDRQKNPNLAAWHVSPRAAMSVILEVPKNAGYLHVIFDPEPNQPMYCVSIDGLLAAIGDTKAAD
jgi:hypothetical protein